MKRKFKLVIVILIMLIVFALTATILYMGKTWIFFDSSGCRPIETLDYNEAYSGEDTNINPLVNSAGKTVESRFNTPDGYTRIISQQNTFIEYTRSIKLKEDGSKIEYFNGNETDNVNSAVFEFDTGNKDIQQCADSIIRVYSEYYYAKGEYEKISFHLSNGTLMNYTDWQNGERLFAAGNFAVMVKAAPYNNSYECFRQYLESVMNYAGTKSLDAESENIPLSELTVGDILIIPGSPGHVVLVVDEAQNSNGDKCWLFAQGYMPAQNFHMLVNPAHYDDMWYYENEITETIKTSPCTFSKDDICRWNEGLQ